MLPTHRYLVISAVLAVAAGCGKAPRPAPNLKVPFVAGVYRPPADMDPPLRIVLNVMPDGTFEICNPDEDRGEFCIYGRWSYEAATVRLHKLSSGPRGEEPLDSPHGGQVEAWTWRDGALYSPRSGVPYRRTGEGD